MPTRSTFPQRRRHLAAAGVAVALALLGGCSSASAGGAADVGAPQRSGGFSRNAVENVPAPADGTSEGNAATQQGTTNQTYRIPGSPPADAIQTYEQLAARDGWQTASAPVASGATDWTMTLTKGSSTLLVTTAPAGDGSGDTEMSLEVSSA